MWGGQYAVFLAVDVIQHTTNVSHVKNVKPEPLHACLPKMERALVRTPLSAAATHGALPLAGMRSGSP